jgi:hypothetical protein
VQGSDWNGQVKLGNSQFVGLNYLQSVTPTLALGGEAFWLGQQRKSGAGFAARLASDAYVATAQIATTGLVSLTYLRRISEKVRAYTPELRTHLDCASSYVFGNKMMSTRRKCVHYVASWIGFHLVHSWADKQCVHAGVPRH